MKRTISAILGAIILMAGGQAFAANPPVAPVGLGSGLGCAAQCIKQALVTPSMTGGSLEVKTDTPARIKIWVSDQAPASIDGMPWIPNPDDYLETWNYYVQHTFSLDSLTAGTTQHILVTATDHEGRTAYRLGTFRTLDPPPLPPAVHHEEGQSVKVTFWKVKILNDADNPGKGEISFRFCAGGDCGGPGEMPSTKLNTGQTYTAFETRIVQDVGDDIELVVHGEESDIYVVRPNTYDRSVARSVFNLDNLHDDVFAGDYGGMPFGHDAYFVFESPNDDYLEFRVYAWVDILSD